MAKLVKNFSNACDYIARKLMTGEPVRPNRYVYHPEYETVTIEVDIADIFAAMDAESWMPAPTSAYPTKIVQNGPAVIIFWSDGGKTIVKKMDSDEQDIYAAVAQAMMKRLCGSTSAFHRAVDKLLVKQEE